MVIKSRLARGAIISCLFIFNLCGYVLFRHSISDDIFGGDAVNMSLFRMDSYFLKHSDIINDPSALYSAISRGEKGSPRLDPNAFVFNLLSAKGRLTLKELIADPSRKINVNAFLLELNRSIIEQTIVWPKAFVGDLKIDPSWPSAMRTRNYNLLALSRIYPASISPVSIQTKSTWQKTLKSLPDVARYYFTCSNEPPARYSPVVNIYVSLVQDYLRNARERVGIGIFWIGLFYALWMVLVFLFSLKLIDSVPWALMATFFYQAAMSTLTSSYTVFSLPYLFVPLTMLAAFYSYLRFKENGNWFWFISFVLFSVIGPWVREFPSAIPFIVLACEVFSFKGRRSLWLTVASVFLCGHALYPSFLPWLIGLNTGKFHFLFASGIVKQQWGKSWYLISFLFVQVPPTLWVLAVTAIGFWIWSGVPDSISSRRHWILKPFAVRALFFAIIGLFIYSFYIRNAHIDSTAVRMGLCQFIFVAAVAMTALKFNRIAPVFFLVTLIPALALRLWEVHLSFILAPLVIMLILWIKWLSNFLIIHDKDRKSKCLRIIFSLLLVIAILDQSLNIPGAWLTQSALVRVNKKMGEWIRANIPRHSIIVCNFYNAADVFYYSDYHFDPYLSHNSSPFGMSKVVSKSEEFVSLWSQDSGLRDIYLLAADHTYFGWTKDSSSHRYVVNPLGKMEKSAVFPVKINYYYLDPLKYVTPRLFVSFPGYMDWFTDFYYDNDAVMFKRVVSTEYALYKVNDVSYYSIPRQSGKLKGYNIIEWNRAFYGIPEHLDYLDLNLSADRNHEGVLAGSDSRQIEKLIYNETPRFIKAYKKSNIFYYGSRYYAAPQSWGGNDLVGDINGARPGIATGSSVRKIQFTIDKAARAQFIFKLRRFLADRINSFFRQQPSAPASTQRKS